MIRTKQISWVIGATVRVGNYGATGVDDDVSTVISTALSTAGKGGVGVPVQVSANDDGVGIITAASTNLVQIQRTGSGLKITDAGNNEVYGRLTEAGGVYTLRYFTLADGTETPFNFAASTPIDFDFSYRFDFARLPGDFAIAIPTRVISNDPRGAAAGSQTYSELLTVTALNTLSALTRTPNVAANLFLIINTAIYSTFGGATAAFSVAGKTITWSAANARFNLETTDRVIATYTSLE